MWLWYTNVCITCIVCTFFTLPSAAPQLAGRCVDALRSWSHRELHDHLVLFLRHRHHRRVCLRSAALRCCPTHATAPNVTTLPTQRSSAQLQRIASHCIASHRIASAQRRSVQCVVPTPRQRLHHRLHAHAHAHEHGGLLLPCGGTSSLPSSPAPPFRSPLPPAALTPRRGA